GLDRGGSAETMPRADVSREQLPAILEDHGAQNRSLRQGQTLPHRLKHGVLLCEQTPQRMMQVVEGRPPPGRGTDIVPRLVREALDVVGQVAGQIDDGQAEPTVGTNAGPREPCVDESRELFCWNLVEANDRTCLVEGTPRAEHPFHEARLGSGKYVAHLALALNSAPHHVLDGFAIKACNRLEFIERDHHFAAAFLGQPRGKREDLLGKPRDVAIRADAGKEDGGQAPLADRHIGGVTHFGPGRLDHLAQPAAGPVPAGCGRDERARVPFEKGDVRAETADGNLDGQHSAARHGRQRPPDERRFAVPARGDEEYLLAGRQISNQAIELPGAIGEGGGRNNLAVDEGILHYVKRYNRYVL